MKKTLKRISKTIIILMLLVTMDLSLVANCVQAADSSKEKIYQIDYCEKVLKYQGIARGAAYVVYEENGEQYPAYCINPERIGVGETESYDVNVNGYITDVMLWRIIINGYPYKEVEELGVANKKEAYLATKQAIYCYLDNRNVNEYYGIGEAGARTLNALKQIWNNAQKSVETKISNIVEVISVDSEWEKDKINSKYISKTYRIEAPAPIVDYQVEIQGENLPKDILITNAENNQKRNFIPFEDFKILIPIEQLQKAGEFKINITTKMDTKPVLYGFSSDSNLQNYALTTFTYEDATGSYNEKYPKNDSEIKILKREKTTKKPLEGVEFQVLDANKKVIYQSLITDQNGEISLKNIKPGTYYIKEVRTLDGYVLYDENIKIDISLNEKINVIVNNSKEKNIEISKEITNVEVGKTEQNFEKDLNQTNINKEKNEVNISETLGQTNINKEKNEVNINQALSQTNIDKQLNDINISGILNQSNIIEQKNDINVEKELNKINIDSKLNNIDIDKNLNNVNIDKEANTININLEIKEENVQKLPKTGM